MKKLLCYDYRKITYKDGQYFPETVNLGDYIQTLAAKRFYPEYRDEKNYSLLPLIDRDSLYKSANTDFIANGWYRMSDNHHLWPDSADPLLISVHIKNREGFPKVLEKLRKSSENRPIGCRDLATMDFLKKNGIRCYFSSCLTTTLQRRDWTSKKEEERSGIVFGDIDPKCFAFNSLISRNMFKKLNPTFNRNAKNFFYRIFNKDSYLSFYEKEDISIVRHEISLKTSHNERFLAAEKLLRTFSEAKLVITSRIHCALPCLALGTPVILVAPFDRERYRGIENFINHVYMDAKKHRIIETKIRMENGQVVNDDAFKAYAKKLEQSCSEYMKSKLT